MPRVSKTALWSLTLLLILASTSFAARLITAPQPVKDRYIVTFTSSILPEHVPAVAAEMASRAHGRLLATYQHGVRGFAIDTSEQSIHALLHDPRIETIEEAAVVHISAGSHNPAPWHLDRIDEHTNGDTTRQGYTWNSDGTGVDVYVVDSGIQKNHSEFQSGQVTAGVNYAGLDYYDPNCDTDPNACNNNQQYPADNPCGGWYSDFDAGHGTAVASLIGGQYTGVAPGVRLIPVKVFNCNTQTDPYRGADTTGVMWGLDWILGQANSSGRRSVVNMSFYYDGSFTCDDPTTSGHDGIDCRTAVENNTMNLLNANIVVVTSANNQNDNKCGSQAPARLGYGGYQDYGYSWQRLAITVGGSSENDQRWTYSFTHTNGAFYQGGSNYGPCVNIYAPAHLIHGAHIANSSAYRDQTAYLSGYPLETVASGTSFSAPIVAGVAARLLHRNPTWDVRQVWDYIRTTATTLPTNFDPDGITTNNILVYIGPAE